MPIKTQEGNLVKYTLKEDVGKECYTSTVKEDADGDFEVINEKNEEPTPPIIHIPVYPSYSTPQTADDNLGIMIPIFGLFAVCISAFAIHVRKKRKELNNQRRKHGKE